MSSAPIGDALCGSVEKTLRASAVRRMTNVEVLRNLAALDIFYYSGKETGST